MSYLVIGGLLGFWFLFVFFSKSSPVYGVMHITEARATPTCIYAAGVQCPLLKHHRLPQKG